MIRDVGGSYRRALAETVQHFSGWCPRAEQIDALKGEGRWNNDWDAALELLRRHGQRPLPAYEELVAVFSRLYFGGDPEGDPADWSGFIRQEPLLVRASFFECLTEAGIVWGFVSGAEPASARYVLTERLGLGQPPLVAMGEAPDKPNPAGLLRLASTLCGGPLGAAAPAVAYLGDTVADVQTVIHARRERPEQRLLSLAVAPPHLHAPGLEGQRAAYEESLRAAGANRVLPSTSWLEPASLLGWLAETWPA